MDSHTCRISAFDSDADLAEEQQRRDRVELTHLFELTQEEANNLFNENMKFRKNWMRNKPCPCKSGKKFKKCCIFKVKLENRS
jgi:uncharacterized protein YecA (UPF0149 family)